ncbi:MFS transporter, partial [Streptococcus pneumoniae]|uniref:MFS transporter n=1 Tax=Streptococcus pneumoniae TaxID=1313 RepID=UPI000AF6FD92
MKNKSHQQILLRSLLTLISQLGSSAFAMGVSLFIFQKTDSSISFGLNMIAAPLVTVLLSPIIGKIIDSFNHKSIIIICQIVSIATLLFYIEYFQILDNQILFLTIFVVIVLKIADEFVLLSLYASSINIVHEEEQQKLRSWQQISANCAAIISPIIGATLYGAIPFNLFILAVVFTEFISLILVIAINFRFVVKEESTDGKNDFKDDEKLNLFKWLSEQNYLKDIVFLATVVSSIDTVIYIATPIIILNILEFSNIY